MTLPPPPYNGQPFYPSQQFPPQQYPSQQFPPQQEDPKASTVMVLGIIGIFFGICAFIGWAIGSGAQKQAHAEGRPIDPKLKTWTTVSKVFSIIYIVLAIIWIIILIAGGIMLSSYSKSAYDAMTSSYSKSTDYTEPAQEPAVEITYSHRLPDQDKVQALVDQWNEENPDIQVFAEKFAGVPADFMPQLEQDVQAGSAPCLAQVGYYDLTNAIENDLLEDATEYVTDDVKSTYAGMIEFMNIGGSYYGIPQDSGSLVYLYDKAAFDALGLTVPTTADEFIETAKKAAKAGKYIVAWETDEIGYMLPGLAAASGSEWYVSEDDGFTVNANDAGSKAQAEFWQALRDAHAVKDVARWDDMSQFDAALTGGSLIGVFAPSWDATILPSAFGASADTPVDGTWQAALLPDFGAGRLSGPDGGSGVALVKGCAYPEEAMAFNIWLNDQVDFLVDQGLIPSSTTPAETPDWIKKFYAGQDVYSVFAEANSVTGVIASIPGWDEVTAAIVDKGAEVQSGSAKVADIFMAADETSKSALQMEGYTVK